MTSYSRPSPRGMPDLADAWEPTMPDNESILSWELRTGLDRRPQPCDGDSEPLNLAFSVRTVPEPVLLCFQRKASEGPVNIRMRMSVFSVKFSFISSTMNSSESVPGFRPLGVAGGRT